MEETRDQIMGEITALKMLLRDSDYEIIKLAEGFADCNTATDFTRVAKAFWADYRAIVENRRAWRSKIRDLEARSEQLAAAQAEESTDTEYDTPQIEPETAAENMPEQPEQAETSNPTVAEEAFNSENSDDFHSVDEALDNLFDGEDDGD